MDLVHLLVLHPRHKLDYFKKAGWKAEWITAARQIVRDEFERSYADSPVADADEVDTMVCVFLFHNGMSSSNRIFSHRYQSPSISSIISLPLHLPRQQISAMNSTASLARIPKVCWMFWHGGMRNGISFLVSPEWR
jgi:hypothetical protein